jgi:triacylglycerol esterase/lipase EstA (alpha/beta hydrolase family)
MAGSAKRLFAFLALFAVAVLAVSASAAAAARPTIVLVHGAWAGPDGWDQVVAALDKDGYSTATPRARSRNG